VPTRPRPKIEYTTATEFAHALGISVITVSRWVRDGIVRAVDIDGTGRKRILRSEIKRVRAERSGRAPRAN